MREISNLPSFDWSGTLTMSEAELHPVLKWKWMKKPAQVPITLHRPPACRHSASKATCLFLSWVALWQWAKQNVHEEKKSQMCSKWRKGFLFCRYFKHSLFKSSWGKFAVFWVELHFDNKQSRKAPHPKVKMNENSLGKFQLHFPDHCTCMLAGNLHLKQLTVFWAECHFDNKHEKCPNIKMNEKTWTNLNYYSIQSILNTFNIFYTWSKKKFYITEYHIWP